MITCLYLQSSNTDINIFNDEVQQILEYLKQNKVYLCGDFNIDLLKYDSHQYSRNFVNNIFSYGYYPLINSPTRITCNSSTLIDNIFTNVIAKQMMSGSMINDIYDHLPLFTIFVDENVANQISSEPKLYKYIRQTKDENITTFVNRVSDTEWNDVYDCNDVNNAYKLFLEKYIDEYNYSCPIVKVKKPE